MYDVYSLQKKKEFRDCYIPIIFRNCILINFLITEICLPKFKMIKTKTYLCFLNYEASHKTFLILPATQTYLEILTIHYKLTCEFSV